MTELLNYYSGWLGFIAIIISVPIGVGVNLATPKIQRWFAQKSRKSIEKRILQLENLLTDTQKLVSDQIQLNARLFLIMAINNRRQTTITLAIVVGAVLVIYSSINQPHITLIIIILFAFLNGYAASRLSKMRSEFRELYFRVTSYDEWKEETEKEIEQLKSKLGQFDDKD